MSCLLSESFQPCSLYLRRETHATCVWGALCQLISAGWINGTLKGKRNKDKKLLFSLHWVVPLASCVIGLPWWLSGKELTGQYRRCRFNPWIRKIPWSRKWQPTPVFLPGKSHGQRDWMGYSPWGCKSQTQLSN